MSAREATSIEVSSEEFNRDPQHYLDEVAQGRTVMVSSPSGDFVIVRQEEFEGYMATAELLEHPDDREAIIKSLAELAGSPRKR